MDLRDKVLWLTGGTRMGGVIAQAFADRGCHIAIAWRRSKRAAEEVAAALRAQGRNALIVRCDLAQRASVERALRSIEERFGRLDVVINLASIYGATPLKNGDPLRAWDENLANNARSAYLLSLTVRDLLQRGEGGRLIHVSDWTSASGRPRYKDFSPYYISKAAVKAVVEALALELAPKILVNGIAPGPMLPPAGMSRRELAAVAKATPLGRWGGAEEMARAALFLAETEFVTGEVIRVDGGRHLY